jgi:hypothetical protein
MSAITLFLLTVFQLGNQEANTPGPADARKELARSEAASLLLEKPGLSAEREQAKEAAAAAKALLKRGGWGPKEGHPPPYLTINRPLLPAVEPRQPHSPGPVGTLADEFAELAALAVFL